MAQQSNLNIFEQLIGMLTGGVKFPWQTPAGEGFISPFTEKVPTTTGWAQAPTVGAAGVLPTNVVKTWSTGTATFHMLADGRIACQKKNGVWKIWRPAKHIVVPRNPRIGTLIRADKRINKLMTGLARRAGVARRRPRARVQPAYQYLSPAEIKLLGKGG